MPAFTKCQHTLLDRHARIFLQIGSPKTFVIWYIMLWYSSFQLEDTDDNPSQGKKTPKSLQLWSKNKEIELVVPFKSHSRDNFGEIIHCLRVLERHGAYPKLRHIYPLPTWSLKGSPFSWMIYGIWIIVSAKYEFQDQKSDLILFTAELSCCHLQKTSKPVAARWRHKSQILLLDSQNCFRRPGDMFFEAFLSSESTSWHKRCSQEFSSESPPCKTNHYA